MWLCGDLKMSWLFSLGVSMGVANDDIDGKGCCGMSRLRASDGVEGESAYDANEVADGVRRRRLLPNDSWW